MKNTTKPTKPAVLAMAAITTLPQKERIAAFAERASVNQRAFAEMGKLLFSIAENLRPNETIFGLLRKAGIKKGTVSNASYASKVWELVQDGKLTENEYDGFTFQDCLSIVRATGSNAKQRLTPADLAAVVRASRDFSEELACLYEHGVTLAEKAAADAAATTVPPPAIPASVSASADSTPSTGPEAEIPPARNAADKSTKIVALPAPEPTNQTAEQLIEQLENVLRGLPIKTIRELAPRLLKLAETVAQLSAHQSARAA